jgi:predicted dehydrogenase
MARASQDSERGVVRYAVVGLGHIAQVAALPAFAHARKNSRLVALVSGDAAKRRALSRRYRGVEVIDYDHYAELLKSGRVDAVYIAVPNHLHREYAVAAAEAGVHVLCEKPMAVGADECHTMIRAAERNRVKLMIAYRLHFDPATLRTLEAVRKGKIGQPRIFESLFTMQVRKENVRLDREKGGGPLLDIGIYCINAARQVFGAEPIEVLGAAFTGGDARFGEVEECFSGILRFPGDCTAAFTCSFGASDISSYRIVGTQGDVLVEPAYSHAMGSTVRLRSRGRTRVQKFGPHDQFAPEFLHFSECILQEREPVPSGQEGLADVRVINALSESAQLGAPVKLAPVAKRAHPGRELEMKSVALREPDAIRARGPRKKLDAR